MLVQRAGAFRRLVLAALRREQVGLKLHVVKRRGERRAPRGQLRHQPLGAKENQAVRATQQRRERLRGLHGIHALAQQAMRKGDRSPAAA